VKVDSREGEAPAEPTICGNTRLGRSLALPSAQSNATAPFQQSRISIRMNPVTSDRAPDTNQESRIGQYEAVRGPRAGDPDTAVQRKPSEGRQCKEHREWHACRHRDERRLSRNQQC